MNRNKKILTTILLSAVLSCVPATVANASNFNEINKWIETNEGWKAIDENGKYIENGFAKSKSGLWYYFDSQYMLTNSFITYKGETYYLGNEGAMHTGWALFDDMDVTYDNVDYNDVADAFDIDDIGQTNATPFTLDNNGAYEKLWFYFNEDGTMVEDEWLQKDNLWYYMQGPVCLINEWSAELPVSNNSKKTANYGFSGNGNMHVGWIKDTTKEYPSKDNTDINWTYYDADGRQAKLGWKKLDNEWTFFNENEKYGSSLLTNTILEDENDRFYVNEDGYMVTDKINLYAKNKDIDISHKEIRDTQVVTSSSITIKEGTNISLLFNKNGTQATGIKNKNYYLEKNASIYEVLNENAVNNEVTATKMDLSDILIGTKLKNNFFYIDKNDDIFYFKNGEMVKNDIVKFKDILIATDKNGKLISINDETISINGKKYIKDDTKLIIEDIIINGIKK